MPRLIAAVICAVDGGLHALAAGAEKTFRSFITVGTLPPRPVADSGIGNCSS